MVGITGQVPRPTCIGTDAFQEADIQGITMPITKHYCLVSEVEDIPRVMKEAFHIATHRPAGPVLIDIPKDIQHRRPDWEPEHGPARLQADQARPPRQVSRQPRRSSPAKRPFIYAGGGAVSSERRPAEPEGVAEPCIPVIMTLTASAFPATHPLCLAMLGCTASSTRTTRSTTPTC